MTQSDAGALVAPIGLRWPRLLAALLTVEVALFALDLVATTGRLGGQMSRWLDLDTEQSVGTWFSSGQLLWTALVLWGVGSTEAGPTAVSRWFVRLLAGMLLFLSLDEAISIHESITNMVRRRAEWMPLFPGEHGAWIPLYALLGLAGTAATWRQLAALWGGHRAAAALGLAGLGSLLLGAVGLEVAGYVGWFANMPLESALEEFLEMAGGSLMLCAAARFAGGGDELSKALSPQSVGG